MKCIDELAKDFESVNLGGTVTGIRTGLTMAWNAVSLDAMIKHGIDESEALTALNRLRAELEREI